MSQTALFQVSDAPCKIGLGMRFKAESKIDLSSRFAFFCYITQLLGYIKLLKWCAMD